MESLGAFSPLASCLQPARKPVLDVDGGGGGSGGGDGGEGAEQHLLLRGPPPHLHLEVCTSHPALPERARRREVVEGRRELEGVETTHLHPDLAVPPCEEEGGDEGVEEGEEEDEGRAPWWEGGHPREGGGGVEGAPAEEDGGDGGEVDPGRLALLPPHQLAGVAHPVPEGAGEGAPEGGGGEEGGPLLVLAQGEGHHRHVRDVVDVLATCWVQAVPPCPL